MKIAFITQQMIVGGAETYIVRKASWLIEHGYDVIVMSKGGECVEMLPKGITHIDIDCMCPPYSVGYHSLNKTIKRLGNILLEENVDLIEVHNSYPAIYVVMSYWYHRIPFILNVLLESDYDNNYALRFLTILLDKKKQYCTLTVGMNAYIEKRCKHKLSPQIFPIPIFQPTPKFLKTENYLLTVGRLTSDKMYLKYLIQDFKTLHIKNQIPKELKLIVVGDGLLREDVAKEVALVNKDLRREAILMKGIVMGEALDRLYEQCLAYIGVGTTILIAASFRKPVILASGIKNCQPYAYGFWGENPEIDRNNLGGDESLFSKRTSFLKIIKEIVVDEKQREQAGRKAFALFESVYDMKYIMNEWDKFYKGGSNMKYDKMISYMGRFLYVAYIILSPIYYIYRLSVRPLLKYKK
ncbi:glycosyltransferase family 4 protein [Parabacteroides sp. APC149_11_2_Y6]